MTIAEIIQVVEKAARIIYYGLSNPKKLGSNSEYQNLYREYVVSSELQSYVEVIAESLELYLIGVEKDVIYLSPKKDSPFLPRLKDIPVLGKEKNRGIFILIMVAIAAYFFHDKHSFHQRGYHIPGLDSETLHRYIIDKIEQIKTEKGENILNIDKNSPELNRLLSIYYSMKKDSDKNIYSTTKYFIEKTFDYMEQLRLLTIDNEKYIPTSRFRLQMEDFSNKELYLHFVNTLHQPEEEET